MSRPSYSTKQWQNKNLSSNYLYLFIMPKHINNYACSSFFKAITWHRRINIFRAFYPSLHSQSQHQNINYTKTNTNNNSKTTWKLHQQNYTHFSLSCSTMPRSKNVFGSVLASQDMVVWYPQVAYVPFCGVVGSLVYWDSLIPLFAQLVHKLCLMKKTLVLSKQKCSHGLSPWTCNG